MAASLLLLLWLPACCWCCGCQPVAAVVAASLLLVLWLNAVCVLRSGADANGNRPSPLMAEEPPPPVKRLAARDNTSERRETRVQTNGPKSLLPRQKAGSPKDEKRGEGRSNGPKNLLQQAFTLARRPDRLKGPRASFPQSFPLPQASWLLAVLFLLALLFLLFLLALLPYVYFLALLP